MAETLGSLLDKLTVVKLKLWHTSDAARKESLLGQSSRLAEEIDEYLEGAFSGAIPRERITFASNKVVARDGAVEGFPREGSAGELFGELATVNCELWHEQEKVYEFEKVPASKKDAVVKRLATLNLMRTSLIDAIDRELLTVLEVSR
ncbi:MAG: hypothetical protein ACE5F1_21015 [Planctomycetota bacterium]